MGRKRRLAQVTGHEMPETLIGKAPVRELDQPGAHAARTENARDQPGTVRGGVHP